MLYCIGGSTNAIIHLLAIANELDIDFDINEFNKYSDIPILLNMKPHGENMMYHLHENGGMTVFIMSWDMVVPVVRNIRKVFGR